MQNLRGAVPVSVMVGVATSRDSMALARHAEECGVGSVAACSSLR